MTRNLYKQTFGLLAFLLILPSYLFAQENVKKITELKKRFVESRTTTDLSQISLIENIMPRKLMPLEHTLPSVKYELHEEARPYTHDALANILMQSGNTPIWGNLMYQKGWTAATAKFGVYAFNPVNPLTVQPIGVYGTMEGNYGSALVGDVYHIIKGDFKYASLGIIMVYHYKFDANTWEPIGSFELLDKRYDLLAQELAYDKVNDKIYGEFFSKDLKSNEFGVIDYNTMTRTTFGTATHKYAALGITKEGVLYGVAEDGNLYRISATTGEETLVGSTGVVISDEKGKFYGQSGEIDQRTNTFYWTCIDNEGKSILYTVDLMTGAATKVADFPAKEQFQGLMFPEKVAEDGAPAEAQQLTTTFDGPNTSGLFAFTAPTTTYGGDPLSGALNYKVLLNNEIFDNGTINAGETKTLNVNNIAEGMAVFTVILTNAAGDSPKAIKKQWIGYDIPMPARRVQFTLNKENGEANISWSAPTAMVNNGYRGTLTYEVVRMPDRKVVAQGITATQTTDLIDPNTKETSWQYLVYVHNGNKKSRPAISSSELFGDGNEPPYLETFDNKDAISSFTIIDGNGDYTKWSFDNDKQAMSCYHNKTKPTDDWLITPKFKLEAGRKYTFALKAASFGSTQVERFEVKIGKDRTVEAMTTEILPGTDVKHKEFKEYKTEFTVEENGNYFFGVHGISEPDRFGLYIDDIEIMTGAKEAAPKASSDLAFTPNANGANKTTIQFKAPREAINGTILQSINKIIVKREDVEVKVFNNPQPGESLNFEDTTPQNGFYNYAIIAYNEHGFGETAMLKAYVGLDVPTTAKNRKLSDANGKVKFTWDKVVGIGTNGGYVNPENVKYIIYDVFKNTAGETVAAERDSTTALEYLVDMNTEEGEQRLMQMGLAVKNEVGKSKIVGSDGFAVGNPYTLPFMDGFANTSNLWWTNQIGKGGFYLSSKNSSDNDGECVVFDSENSQDEGWLNSGKVTLKGTINPQFTFDYYIPTQSNLRLAIEIETPNGRVETLKTLTFTNSDNTGRWIKERLEVPEKFANERYVFFKFHAISSEGKQTVAVDNIAIKDVLQYNLSTELTAPTNVYKGEAAAVNITVRNEGSKAISGYIVRLKAGEEILNEDVIREKIEPYTDKVFNYQYKNSVFKNQKAINLEATVEYKYDLDISDNIAQSTIYVDNSELPFPVNVVQNANEDNTSIITWNAPTATGKTVFEDFESYQPWLIDNIGNWKLADRDLGTTGEFPNYTFPHKGEEMAYILFNPEAAGISTEVNTFLKPRSGNQYLASFYSYDIEAQELIEQDNWLISPELSGESQTVTAYLRNTKLRTENAIEKYEVYYSTTSNEVYDFKLLQAEQELSSGQWEQVNVSLPEGTKYFAIRQVGKAGYFFMIDDITYQTSTGTLMGYNIYCNGVLEATVSAETNSYIPINKEDKNTTYHVSAIFSDGESAPQKAKNVTSGIEEIRNSVDKHYNVYTLDGKCVGKKLNSLSNLPKGVYIINHKKVVIK